MNHTIMDMRNQNNKNNGDKSFNHGKIKHASEISYPYFLYLNVRIKKGFRS